MKRKKSRQALDIKTILAIATAIKFLGYPSFKEGMLIGIIIFLLGVVFSLLIRK